MTDQTPHSKNSNELTPQCDAPLGPHEFIRMALQPLVLVYGVPEGAASHAFWRLYFNALEGLPVEAIVGAVNDYASTDEQFFPKPGRLRTLAMSRATMIWNAERRDREIVQQIKQSERLFLEGPTVEKLKAPITNGFAALLKKLEDLDPPKPKPTLKPIQAKVGSGGISPELQELVRAQRDG
jgi:hypothetical protein